MSDEREERLWDAAYAASVAVQVDRLFQRGERAYDIENIFVDAYQAKTAADIAIMKWRTATQQTSVAKEKP